MKRLATTNFNTADEYDRIFLERWQKGIGSDDLRRWKLLLKYYKGGAIVDLGCLDSQIFRLLEKYYQKQGFYYLGVDQAKQAIEEMRTTVPVFSSIQFEVLNIYNTTITSSFADYVVMGEVLEHLENPKMAIVEAMRILKTGGTLALSVPLNEAIEPGAVDKKHHLWSFDKKDILDLLTPYGPVKTTVMRSQYKPVYHYVFPIIIAYCTKA